MNAPTFQPDPHAPVVLVADPPWQLSDALPGPGRGASKHYPCMPLARLMRYRLPREVRDAEHAVLFLWRLSSLPHEALALAEAWGFRPHSELVWDKRTASGRRHFGMGRIVRGSHETVLIAVRGKAPPALRNQRSIFEGTVGVHSEKPEEFYAIVERMYPLSARFELFARRRREGWAQRGKELGKLG